MEANMTFLRRRNLLSSALLGAIGGTVGGSAKAATLQYPQLTNAAISVLHPTNAYFVTGANAGPRVLAGGQKGLIIYSDNGGQSWHQAKVPFSGTITSIAFASAKVGWATGELGVILKTEDGGENWVKQLDGIAEIALMNTATQAYVAAQEPGSDNADRATRRAKILTSQGPDKPFLSLLPISETEIFAFGAYRFAEHSTDGGKSWTDWSMNIDDPVSHNIYDAANINGAYYLVSEASLIFKSTDGGRTFPKLAQPGNATFFGITDTGAGGILAYGVAGEIYLSTDQGKTWTQPNFTGQSNINTISALPGSGLLVAGDAGGGLWISKDHGNSFVLANRNPIMSINDLVPLGPMGFLLVTSVGVFAVPDMTKMHH